MSMSLRDVNPSQGFKATPEELDWGLEEDHWRKNWETRPYVIADLGFEYYSPAYRYGYESAAIYRGRAFDDVENDLREGWNRYEHRGKATWENVKDAVRDGWHRLTNR
jgi:hypothetical protein